MAPGAAHHGCGLPYNLSNFQSFYACDDSILVGRPNTIEDVKDLVSQYSQVQAVGVGHSWNKGQFCATNGNSSLNLVTTELVDTLNFIENPVDPSQWVGTTIPDSFPIHVDEGAATVRAAAGVPQRMLLDYLASYTHWSEPAGWTLPAFSWFIDQTIGGAVSTGTHGSSMTWGSLSSQLRGLKMVVANGTEITLTPEGDAHLWRAAGVGVGRLGVVTEVTLVIVPQSAVTKTLTQPGIDQLTQEIWAVQNAYVAAKEAGDVAAMKDALAGLDETQVFWAVPSGQTYRMDWTYLGKEPANVLPNIDLTAGVMPNVSAADGPSTQIVFDQVPSTPVSPNALMPFDTRQWNEFYVAAISGYIQPGTYARSKSFVAQSEFTTENTNFAPYDQYEMAVPIERAGSCLAALNQAIYGSDQLWQGFRTPALFRFVNGEEYYLSTLNGGPRMFVNMEDYISRSSGVENVPFQKVMSFFRENCDARMHWGKAGWPQHAACFDGAVEYADTWCDFGCAANQLDPTGKFKPETDLWQWHATRDGAAVDFQSCCTPEGFSDQCTCAKRPSC